MIIYLLNLISYIFYSLFDFFQLVKIGLMKVSTILCFCILIFVPALSAAPYEVLVVDIAKTGNLKKIEEFEKTTAEFNALQYKGYSAAKPYFNVLRLANGRVYFVFGFKDHVQGIHRENYKRTVKNLRRLKNGGTQRYPDMHWVPVDEIRKQLVAP